MSLGKRVGQPSWKQPETTGEGKLGVGKEVFPLGLEDERPCRTPVGSGEDILATGRVKEP